MVGKSGEFHGRLSIKRLVSERIYVPPIFGSMLNFGEVCP